MDDRSEGAGGQGGDDKLIETEFEMNEQVFVPAGDGEPAKWMRKGDLHVDEMARYVEHLRASANLQMERATRYCELLEEAVVDEGEMAELAALKLVLDAQEREQDRRQAAIDRDIAAGRYWVIGGEPPA